MTSAPPSIDVDQEVLCPICKDYLAEPVTLDCGHNYCKGCITDCCRIWEEQDVGDLGCPVCKARMRRGSFRPNWQLANIVEKIKLQSKGLEDLCKRHKEKLHLFCKEDKELVCLVCERCPEHKSHTVVIKEEAAQEYKTIICRQLEHLRKEREKILAYDANMGNESNELLKLTETERQNTLKRFKQLHHFLEEEEKRLLNEIDEMKKEITKRRDEQLARLSDELSSLERSIREMEEKSQQPVSELLQDVRSTLQRCQQREIFKDPQAFPPKLKRRISKFHVKNPILYAVMKEIKDVLSFGRNPQKDVLSFGRNPQKANVILDLDTAYPRLILSRNRKSVRRGDKSQDLPDNPERFSSQPCVLGCEGFTAGRHFWEVNVESGKWWALGVARKSVRRKGIFPLSPKGGIWAVGMDDAKYSVYTSPVSSPLSLSEEPRRIRVTLDYEGGRVSFSDADSGAELHTFSGASFSRGTLFPFFYLRGYQTHLSIS
ncbi:tripartite motif-containing protein 10-like [Podarcis muralis]